MSDVPTDISADDLKEAVKTSQMSINDLKEVLEETEETPQISVYDLNQAEPYQVMPELDTDEYRALKNDIAENGVRVPITIDDEYTIIDGHHRAQACRDLGVEHPPFDIRSGLDEDEKISLAWRLNMQRRHLETDAKKDRVIDRIDGLIERGTHSTDLELNEELGVSEGHIATKRKERIEELISEDDVEILSSEDSNKALLKFASQDQIKTRVVDVILEDPSKSDAEIAEEWDLDRSTVWSYRQELNTVYQPQLACTDANDVLQQLPDESVDLIVTDPPYGIGFSGNRYQTADHDELEGDADHDLYDGLADELYRVLKPDSHCYVFTRWDVYPAVLEHLRHPFEVDTVLVWDKKDGGHGMGDTEDFAPRHEFIIKLSKGDRPINGDRKPNVIRQKDARFTGEENVHPTQKPQALMETLIEASSDGGDIVADFFGGSYPVARAAVKTGRQAVACELDEEHHYAGKRMVDATVKNADGDRTMLKEVEIDIDVEGNGGEDT